MIQQDGQVIFYQTEIPIKDNHVVGRAPRDVDDLAILDFEAFAREVVVEVLIFVNVLRGWQGCSYGISYPSCSVLLVLRAGENGRTPC